MGQAPLNRDFPFNFINMAPIRLDTVLEVLLYNSRPIIRNYRQNVKKFLAGRARNAALNTGKAMYLREDHTSSNYLGTRPPLSVSFPSILDFLAVHVHTWLLRRHLFGLSVLTVAGQSALRDEYEGFFNYSTGPSDQDPASQEKRQRCWREHRLADHQARRLFLRHRRREF